MSPNRPKLSSNNIIDSRQNINPRSPNISTSPQAVKYSGNINFESPSFASKYKSNQEGYKLANSASNKVIKRTNNSSYVAIDQIKKIKSIHNSPKRRRTPDITEHVSENRGYIQSNTKRTVLTTNTKRENVQTILDSNKFKGNYSGKNSLKMLQSSKNSLHASIRDSYKTIYDKSVGKKIDTGSLQFEKNGTQVGSESQRNTHRDDNKSKNKLTRHDNSPS